MPNDTLYIDPETRDLAFDEDGNLRMIDGDDSTAQAVRHTLLTWRGEFPLDITHGTAYEQVMGKKANELRRDDLPEVMREAIFQEDQISAVESLEATLDDRSVSAVFVASLSDGQKISMEVKA